MLAIRRLRWISYVDEYGPILRYIEGPRNVIADTFSRLLRKDVPSALVGKKGRKSLTLLATQKATMKLSH